MFLSNTGKVALLDTSMELREEHTVEEANGGKYGDKQERQAKRVEAGATMSTRPQCDARVIRLLPPCKVNEDDVV